MPPSQMPPYYQDDEITLKELILKIREFWRELLKNWFWLLLLGAIFGGAFLAKAILQDTTYRAGISFMVSEDDSSEQGRVISPYAAIDFGRVTNNKITELARSGRIIHQVLMNRVPLDSRYDYIANHLIQTYDLQNEWGKEPLVEEFKYLHLDGFEFTRDSLQSFTPREYRALNYVHELLAGNNLTNEKGIMSISFDDDSDIFRLNIESLNEQLSMIVITAVYEELREFYIEETVGRPRRTLELLETEVDSLFNVRTKLEERKARATDRDRNIISSVYRLSLTDLERELVLLDQEYNESSRFKKDLEILLSSTTPEFQVIDRTFIPVKNEPSKLKNLVLGGFLGLFLGVIYFIGRKIVRDAMA